MEAKLTGAHKNYNWALVGCPAWDWATQGYTFRIDPNAGGARAKETQGRGNQEAFSEEVSFPG